MKRQKHLGMNEIKKHIINILSKPLGYVPYKKSSTIIKPKDLNNYVKRANGGIKPNRKGTDSTSTR